MGLGAGDQAESRRFEPGHPLLSLASRLSLGIRSYIYPAIDWELGAVQEAAGQSVGSSPGNGAARCPR